MKKLATLILATATALTAMAAMPKRGAEPSFRPEVINGVATIDDMIEIPSADRTRIFVQTLKHVAQDLDGEEQGFESIDFDGRRFVANKKVSNGATGKDAATYKYQIAIQAADGIMSFAVQDIDISYKEKGVVPMTRNYAKLNFEKNKRHQELADEFSSIVSQTIDSIAASVSEPYQKISHWDEIKAQKVVKGMNETEVILTLGYPEYVRSNKTKTKWTYSNDLVVIFGTDGLVISVID